MRDLICLIVFIDISVVPHVSEAEHHTHFDGCVPMSHWIESKIGLVSSKGPVGQLGRGATVLRV